MYWGLGYTPGRELQRVIGRRGVLSDFSIPKGASTCMPGSVDLRPFHEGCDGHIRHLRPVVR